MESKDQQFVRVIDFDMPFKSMIIFMVKWAIASIPAIIILAVIFSLLLTFGSAVLLSLKPSASSTYTAPTYSAIPVWDERAVELKNEGYNWALNKKLTDDAMCNELDHEMKVVGCKAYVKSYSHLNK